MHPSSNGNVGVDLTDPAKIRDEGIPDGSPRNFEIRPPNKMVQAVSIPHTSHIHDLNLQETVARHLDVPRVQELTPQRQRDKPPAVIVAAVIALAGRPNVEPQTVPER